jgi:cupin 2 domain-containing protein
MNDIKNIFNGIPASISNEIQETILQGSSFRIERIVSHGHRSPDGFWYDQEENEWVIVLKGSAILRFEDKDEDIAMNPGNFINIEKHQRHRVEWTDPDQETIWLALHYKF